MSLPSMSPSLPICMEGLGNVLCTSRDSSGRSRTKSLGMLTQLELQLRGPGGQVLSQTRAPAPPGAVVPDAVTSLGAAAPPAGSESLSRRGGREVVRSEARFSGSHVLTPPC